MLQKQSLTLIQLCWSYTNDEFQFLFGHQLITSNHFQSNVFSFIKACIFFFYFQSAWLKESLKYCSCMTFWPAAAPWRRRMWRKKYSLLNRPWQLCFLRGKKKHLRDETLHKRWRTKYAALSNIQILVFSRMDDSYGKKKRIMRILEKTA